MDAISAATHRLGTRAEPVLELRLNAFHLVGFGLELQGAAPLKARFGLAVSAPISIAQVIVDGRILGQQLDRALEIARCLREVTEPEIGPAETVDDIAVIGPQLHRAL